MPQAPSTRSYTVLRKGVNQSPSAPQLWEFVRNVEASTVEQAVTKTVEVLLAASEDNKVEGTFVAIASRSFKPIPVDVEVTTRIKLG